MSAVKVFIQLVLEQVGTTEVERAQIVVSNKVVAVVQRILLPHLACSQLSLETKHQFYLLQVAAVDRTTVPLVEQVEAPRAPPALHIPAIKEDQV
jgi:hypothetical protein